MLFRKYFFILIFFFLSLVNVYVFADNFTFIDAKDVSINYNGQPIVWTTSPVYSEDFLYVPLRDLMPPLDISLFTNRRTLQTTLQRHSDNFQAVLEEGSSSVVIGTRQEKMSRDVRIIKNRMYIPISTFLEKLGYKVVRDSKARKSYSICPIIKTITREKNSFFLESQAPFDYFVDYNNQKKQLHVRVGGSMQNFDRRVLSDSLSPLGLVTFNIRQSEENIADLILDVVFLPETKYNLYKYEGRNILELEIYPPPAKKAGKDKQDQDKKEGHGGIPRDSQPSVNIKSLPPGPTSNVLVPKKEPAKVLFSTGRFDKPSTNSIWLPSVRDRKQLTFSISGVELTLTQPFQYQDGALMVPLRAFFEKAGYNIHVNIPKKQAVVNRDDGIDYLITAGQTSILDRGAGKKGKVLIPIEKAPRIVGDDMYVPLIAFARVIGMGVRWDAKLERVFVNHRIYEVVYEEYNGLRQITLKCTGEINLEKVVENPTPSILYVSIPNTNLDVPNPIIDVNDDKIRTIRLVQLTNNTCRLAVDTKGSIPYGILANDNILEGTMRFPSGISNISLKSNHNVSEVLIQGTGKITPNIQKLEDPYRLVIDVPDSVLKSPQFYEGDGKIINRVRASQFQWNPLVTRIVVELEKNAYFNIQKPKDDKLISVLFSLKEMKEKGKEDLKALIPKKETTASPLFKDVIIVVEAGHGGTDPGSIGVSGVYEKELTLATSKMLQEELEQRGAKVIMARESDNYMSLNDRVVFANQNNADLFISVHYNSFVNNLISGVETYYTKPIDQKLAGFIHRKMVDKLQRTDKGVRKAMLYVLHYTKMPAICIEPLFLSNKWDELLAKDGLIQRKVAIAVTEGIEDYLKNTKRANKKKNE